MEILIEIIVELFLELVLNLFFEGLTEVGGHKLKKVRQKSRDSKAEKARKAGKAEPAELEPMNEETAIVVYTTLGLVLGFLSLIFFPNSFIKNETARLVYLFAGPITAGLIMSLVGRFRDSKGQEPIRLDKFVYGFLFAFALTGLRHLLAP